MRLVKVEAGELFRVLSQAVLFAGKDEYLPMLTTVKLTVRDGCLWAAATDRFGAGVAHCAVEYDGDPFAVLIASRKAKEIARKAKPGPKEKGFKDVELLFNEGGVQATVRAFNSVESTEIASYLDFDFPNLENVFSGLRTSGMAEMDGPYGLAGGMIERIGKAVKLSGSPSAWFTVERSKAVMVRAENLFVLQMPVRLGDRDPHESESVTDDLLSVSRIPLTKPEARSSDAG